MDLLLLIEDYSAACCKLLTKYEQVGDIVADETTTLYEMDPQVSFSSIFCFLLGFIDVFLITGLPVDRFGLQSAVHTFLAKRNQTTCVFADVTIVTLCFDRL